MISYPWPFGDWFGVGTSNFPEGFFRSNIKPDAMSVPLKCRWSRDRFFIKNGYSTVMATQNGAASDMLDR